MTVPPFPSQDLAKLVLGYLAEEQLMTAYDEFLQASPYLDALQNEYDRIFMTSLRNILSEYRAVKIYVETCKPFSVRKKLFQCTNLLEIVKFLVNHIDINKIQALEADKVSYEKQNAIHSFNSTGCDVCNGLKLVNCACKGRQNNQRVANTQPANHVEEETLHNSVETTSLSDLPGNHVTTRKKQIKVLEKGSTLLQSSSSSGHISELSIRQSPEVQSTMSSEQSYSNGNNTQLRVSAENSAITLNSEAKLPDALESKHEIKEFNNVLKSVCNNTTLVNRNDNVTQNVHNRIPCANTFQDFASGVRGCENVNVPDSSTSENLNVQAPTMGNKGMVPEIAKQQIFIKVEPVQSNSQTDKNESRNTNNSYITYPRIKPKPEEHRVKILSDVKVDNSKYQQTVHVLRNATSTPLIPMQTIFINGKPAYKTQSLHPQTQNYTKDEIMAMPTIIVVPTSGPPVVPVKSLPQTVKSSNTTLTTTLSTTQNCSNNFLGPLVIDVSSKPSVSNKEKADATNATSVKVSGETSIAGMVDGVKCGTSVPKDNTITCSAETSTPLVLPTSRKSSSTPRRTSHVRILDFTTPRRILHETINEQVPTLNSDQPTEVDRGLTNVVASDLDTTNTNINENNVIITSQIEISNIDFAKENNSIILSSTNKSRNWDADLRALAIGYASASKTNPRSKSRNPRKKKGSKKTFENDAKDMTNAFEKPRKSKKKQITEVENELENVVKTNIVQIKPTINIKPGPAYGALCTIKKENDKKLDNHIKPNDEERVETPETDRISLQNVIGAKLNISELLETPYKQAFYDIQMDTPKYLGPDLPDDPMSDIKIMNIPTPRFFDSPKNPQATPSSYSSRPTDYSSGGSYYKPDDQDYQPAPDLRCPVTSSKHDEIVEPPKDNINDSKKSSRPVRKCAKNVSYFKSAKTKDVDDKTDGVSSCSDTVSINSSFENKIEKVVNAKTSKESMPQEETKPETKKKTTRKRKSPTTKEKPKTFMKIKPRRTTPIKEFIGGNSRGRKRTSQNSPKLLKHRMSNKDKSSNDALAVNSVPTKSRRKSSTPRKLHCSKTFNSESSGHGSPEVTTDVKQNVTRDTNSVSAQDSDTEQIALRWSDDGSQDIKVSEQQSNPTNDCDDISKIKEYIETTDTSKFSKETESVFHSDLVKRGFDIETAKIIERDLLDTPPHGDPKKQAPTIPIELMENNKDESALDKTLETNSNNSNEQHVTVDEEGDDVEEVELSIHECNPNTENYLVFVHDDTKDVPDNPPITLKDKFSMEVCIDDGLTIRLRATPFSPLFVQDPANDIHQDYNSKETEDAVKSISNIEKLYTPLKECIKAQCFEIFDSTLTSLDTPLKRSPKILQNEVTVTEIILEEEKADAKGKIEAKKRKRIQCSNGSDESLNEYKKPKPDTQYLLASANIQNIDIESVLKKLHGP